MSWRFASAVAAATLIFAPPAAAQQGAPPLLHSIFQDHAVLQRDRPIAIWGHAMPGETVSVTLGDNRAEARAGKDGVWHATLPAMPAGGPFAMTVAAGDRSQRIGDVMIGDVWLCSGQSNMEFAVAQSQNGAAEVAAANDPDTHILTVAHDTGALPKSEFATPVSWQPVTPETIADFSAACWFMARDLRATEKVPFGLIDASWGGTAIDPWRSEASFGKLAGERERLALLATYRRDPAKAAAQYGASWGNWWRDTTGDAPGSEPWSENPPGDWAPVPKFDYWEGWGVPALAAYNGTVWFRTEVTLTAEQAAKSATIALGIADDLDVSFVNVQSIGATASWDAQRVYPLAKGLLHAGKNRIAIAVTDSYGPGGLAGTPDQRAIHFADGTSIPLPPASDWQYRITPNAGGAPHAPWETIAGMAGIYNGMIAPLGDYGLRGAAWYQGESDAGSAKGYAARLTSLMGAWRGQLANPDLPFLIVQLPQWGARVASPSESGFATIRDEQRRAAEAGPHAAIAVTIDVGDPDNLHPLNKQAVGQRLARAARVVAYGKDGPPSGPRAIRATRTGDAVTVAFADISGKLVSFSAPGPIAFELCDREACRFADARIEGNAVRITSGEKPATRVRYCWGDSPICNLYDESGLPAGPFELAIE